jgi:putative ABC transport system substrate-binding protein
MIGKSFFWLLSTLLLALAPLAYAQQPAGKVPRIGFISQPSVSDKVGMQLLDEFRQGLRELGYVEGQNINVEYRYTDGNTKLAAEFVNELVGLKVEVLVVPNDTTARVAKKISNTIPIVMTSSGNPIGQGVIVSLARPGGNVTGLTSYTAELLGKRLALLKEALPNVSRFAFLNSASTGPNASRDAFKESQGTAKALGVTFRLIEVDLSKPDIDQAFRIMAKERIGALVTSPVPNIAARRIRILELIAKDRMPAMHPAQRWTDSGGLMSYGHNEAHQFKRSGVFVGKILKGAKPADLPVEGPTKFDFVINLKAAKQIGVTIPGALLGRADRVIR